MSLREAAQQALEALEWSWGGEPMGTLERDAITALRAALAEPVQPVAWMCPDDPERETAFNWKPGHCENCGKQRVPLYAAPPQRKPLTDEEIGSICAPLGFAQLSPVEVARAIEKAHGITGGSDE